MNLNHLHIALASDQNYAEFVAVVLVSLFDTNKWQEFTTIHLLSNGIDEATIGKLRQHIPDGRGELLVYNISTLKEDLGIDVPPTIAITTYARLFLPQLLSPDVDRVLYLDCDVVVSGSVEDFYKVPFDKNWIAGVRDILRVNYTKTAVGLNLNDEYFNAGVLMINLTAWRENDMTNKCLMFLLDHGGNVLHHDQGILNGVCKNHKVVVHPKYNVNTSYFSHPYSLIIKQNIPFYSSEEVKEATSGPAIIHFTAGFYNRPWIKKSIHPLREVFTHYHALTMWADTPLRPDNRSVATRILAWSFLHLPYGLYARTHHLVSSISLKKISMKKRLSKLNGVVL